MPFKKGQGGRPKGATNIATREKLDAIDYFRRKLLENPDYLDSFVRRVMSGRVSPALELMVFDRVLGKVKEQVRVEHTFDPQQAKDTMREKLQRLITKVEQS